MKVRYWAVPACLIVAAGLLFALFTRSTYKNLPPEELKTYQYSIGSLSGIYNVDLAKVDLDFLLGQADVAVTAVYTGEHSYSASTVDWTMAVKSVLKGEDVGDTLLLEDTIALFIPTRYTGMYYCRGPLIQGHTYLLLLKAVDYPVKPKGPGQYYPLYQSALGCLDLSQTAPSTPFPQGVLVEDILGSSIITCTPEDCALYDSLVEEARTRFGGQQ